MAAWVTYGTFKIESSWSWRIPSLLQAASSVLQLLLIYFVPESPRWLVANNKPQEAERVLSKYHAGSETPNHLVRVELAEISVALESEKEQKTASYLHFARTGKPFR